VHNLKIHNSFSGKKEDFIPLDKNHIKIYACGPTVYNFAHIGNARMAVVFDTFVRLLRHTYPKVTYVSNITDIDDKIITAAREQKLPISEITTKYTQIYNSDMETLGVNKPDHQPKATEYIDEMVELIQTLINKGHAYENDGHVLFHVLTYKQYGSLSKRNREEQIAGSRVEIAPYKKDAADFVLWKPSSDDQPGWDSPWGFGRPGWHTECSAMSEKTLGLPFDIHGGGRDLVFPHHENEIAQSCCASAAIDDPTSYAKYWMHNGFVTVEGEKMSKSLNNITLVKELTDNYQGEVLRLALLSSHYRQGLDWNEKIIYQAEKLLNKLYKILEENSELLSNDNTKVDDEVLNAMSDDLNTPKAISVLNSLAKEYPLLAGSQRINCINKIKSSGQLLGILHQDPKTWFSKDTSHMDVVLIEKLMAKRNEAKLSKNYVEADSIRQQLFSMGVEIFDSKDGSEWKPVSS
jgi:cysteinyl-tRNA synthetase